MENQHVELWNHQTCGFHVSLQILLLKTASAADHMEPGSSGAHMH